MLRWLVSRQSLQAAIQGQTAGRLDRRGGGFSDYGRKLHGAKRRNGGNIALFTDAELPGEPIENNEGTVELGEGSAPSVTPDEQAEAQIDEAAQEASTDDTAPSVNPEQDSNLVQSGDGGAEEPATDEVPVESADDEVAPQADDAAPVTVVDATYKLELMAWNLAEDPEVVLDGDFGLIYADLGKPEDFADKDVAGKIALIKRGELAFVDKIANAKAAGATGAIVFNQNPGPIGVLLGDSFAFIPTFSMSKEDGDYIKSLLDANPDLKVNFTDFIKTEPQAMRLMIPAPEARPKDAGYQA